MQLITAIVAPSKVQVVMHGLRLFGVLGWTLSRVYLLERAQLLVRLDVVAPNADTPDLVHVIARAATDPATAAVPSRATAVGLWVTPVDIVVRISTGERGPAAVT